MNTPDSSPRRDTTPKDYNDGKDAIAAIERGDALPTPEFAVQHGGKMLALMIANLPNAEMLGDAVRDIEHPEKQQQILAELEQILQSAYWAVVTERNVTDANTMALNNKALHPVTVGIVAGITTAALVRIGITPPHDFASEVATILASVGGPAACVAYVMQRLAGNAEHIAQLNRAITKYGNYLVEVRRVQREITDLENQFPAPLLAQIREFYTRRLTQLRKLEAEDPEIAAAPFLKEMPIAQLTGKRQNGSTYPVDIKLRNTWLETLRAGLARVENGRKYGDAGGQLDVVDHPEHANLPYTYHDRVIDMRTGAETLEKQFGNAPLKVLDIDGGATRDECVEFAKSYASSNDTLVLVAHSSGDILVRPNLEATRAPHELVWIRPA